MHVDDEMEVRGVGVEADGRGSERAVGRGHVAPVEGPNALDVGGSDRSVDRVGVAWLARMMSRHLEPDCRIVWEAIERAVVGGVDQPDGKPPRPEFGWVDRRLEPENRQALDFERQHEVRYELAGPGTCSDDERLRPENAGIGLDLHAAASAAWSA